MIIRHHIILPIILIFLLAGIAPPIIAEGDAARQLPVEIDSVLFASTVPSFMVIGRNYTAQVLITNNSNQTLGVVVRIDFPADSILVDPLGAQVFLGPHERAMTDFNLIAYDMHAGRANITAVLFLLDPTPIEVQRVTAPVVSIQRTSESQSVLILAGIITASLVLLFLAVNRFKNSSSRRGKVS